MDKNESDVVDIPEIVETIDEEGKDTTDWKAEAEKYKGIAQRYKTKAEKAKEAKEKPEVKEAKASKTEGLDRIDKMFLRSEKIIASDEVELVESIMKDTGKSVEEVVDSRYFQSELKSLREEKATKDATPTGSKRSGNPSSSEIDYWINKGELPKDFELASKVVEAKMKRARSAQKTFTDTPIV